MKVRLLFPDVDADLKATPPEGAADLVADLDLEPVLEVMVPEPKLATLCPAVLLNPLDDPAVIGWRQRVLADAVADPTGMRALFDLAGRALESQHSIWMYAGRTADSLLSRSIHGLRALLPWLRQLAAFVTELVASELVTNAIRHAEGPIRLRLILDWTLTCEVSDGSETAPIIRRGFIMALRGMFPESEECLRYG